MPARQSCRRRQGRCRSSLLSLALPRSALVNTPLTPEPTYGRHQRGLGSRLQAVPWAAIPRTLTRWPLGTRFCRRKLAVSGQRFVSIRHVRRHLNRSIQCPLSGVKQTSVPPRNKVSAQSRHRSRSRTCITGKLGDLRVRSSPLTKASAWPPDKDLKKIRPSPAGNSASHFRQAIFARAEPRY